VQPPLVMGTVQHGNSIALAVLTSFVVLTSSASAGQARPGSTTQQSRSRTAVRPPQLACGDVLAFQVLLDREGFSPGEIDGVGGPNLQRALKTFQSEHHLPETGARDCETWQELSDDSSESTLIAYELTPNEVKGPFTQRIPTQLNRQNELPALEYRSPLERLAERFHAAPALLQKLNPGARWMAGERIKVPAVTPFDAVMKPQRDPNSDDIAILVSRDESALRATRADGALVFFAPVSSGSLHDPLPPGEWKITGVAWRPVFHYNPDLFWDADPKDGAVSIKAGPNNPVGVVWIAINLEHYGLHGTPEPGRIGGAESHGCVRLTNWDAARLVSLVRPGTPVTFR
jgi:lipoprotein-anchoring transpeptidase ErfK/SrfK